MALLITADIHLTDSPNDDYRWGLIPWLAETAFQNGVDHVLFLGDLTDAKDRHSAALVNRLADQMRRLSEDANVVVLKGNHDFVDPNCPFFGFLRLCPNIDYVWQPTQIGLTVDGRQPTRALFLPATNNWQEDWAPYDPTDYPLIFTHQTFDGVTVENGAVLSGVPRSALKGAGRVFSGDIHTPQLLGRSNIEYIGAPYRVRFGDAFTPRVVLVGAGEPGEVGGKVSSLRFPCPNKHLVEVDRTGEIAASDIQPGDQVKVRVHLSRADVPLWPRLRARIVATADKGGWKLFGPELRFVGEESAPALVPVKRQQATPEDLVRAYGKNEKLNSDMVEIGATIIQSV